VTIEELLIKEEGFVPHAYLDTEGYWTIGYGQLIDERKGGGISRRAAHFMLCEKTDAIREAFDERIPWWRDLNEDRQTILLAMAYQMGVGGLMLFRNTLRAIQEGDYKKAAQGMMASKWARQTPGRAKRMATAMKEGVLP
jgi:lysozyme